MLHFSISDKTLSESRNTIKNLAWNSYVKLELYTNDVQGFFPYVAELRKSIFIFKNEDMKLANAIFQVAKNGYSASHKHSNITMVSIHVRLTDYMNHLSGMYNQTYMSMEFLTKAMTYCNKYQVVSML